MGVEAISWVKMEFCLVGILECFPLPIISICHSYLFPFPVTLLLLIFISDSLWYLNSTWPKIVCESNVIRREIRCSERWTDAVRFHTRWSQTFGLWRLTYKWSTQSPNFLFSFCMCFIQWQHTPEDYPGDTLGVCAFQNQRRRRVEV